MAPRNSCVESVDRDSIDNVLSNVLSRGTIRCTILEREEIRSNRNRNFNDASNTPSPCFPHGMVIDDACSKEWLGVVQSTRKNLPLNHKRPTVDRRFYCDTTRTLICGPLEEIVRHALELVSSFVDDTGTGNESGTKNDETGTFFVYCNKYLRFLEYTTTGGELLPHRDGIKTCEDTGIRSTHTLLLFLSECELGGETLIMDDAQYGTDDNNRSSNWSKEKNLILDVYNDRDENENKNGNENDSSIEKSFNKRRYRYTHEDDRSESVDAAVKTIAKTKVFRLKDASIRSSGSGSSRSNDATGKDDVEELPPPRHISVGIQPREGRILLFPHNWPHAGAMCQSVPKIALRAELTIAQA